MLKDGSLKQIGKELTTLGEDSQLSWTVSDQRRMVAKANGRDFMEQ